jgi:hypothetical protein
MQERRRTPRLKEDNGVTINVVSGKKNLPEEEIPYNSKDISVYGAKIQGNILFPVGTIIKMDITLQTLHQKITTVGKVKWNKFIIENESYEAGVEFFDTSDEAIKKLHELMLKDDAFISDEKWSNLEDLNKYEMPSGGDTFISEGEWSTLQELNKYQIPSEDETFIPEGEWSTLQEINKKEEVSTAKQTKGTIETVEADMKNCRYCSKEIKSDAVKCEYCDRTLSERTDRKVFL